MSIKYCGLLSALFLQCHPATLPPPILDLATTHTTLRRSSLSPEENNLTLPSTYSLGSLSCRSLTRYLCLPSIHYRTLAPIYPVSRGDCLFHCVRQKMDSEAGSAPGPGSWAARGCSFVQRDPVCGKEPSILPIFPLSPLSRANIPPLCCFLTPLLQRVPV